MTHLETAEDEAVYDRLQNPATGALAERPAMRDGLQEMAPGHVCYVVDYCQFGADMVRYPNDWKPFLLGTQSLLPSVVCVGSAHTRETGET